MPAQPQSKAAKPAVPLVPVVPVIPPAVKSPRRPSKNDTSRPPEVPKSGAVVGNGAAELQRDTAAETPTESVADASQASSTQASSPPAPPKSWADLVRSKSVTKGAAVPGASSAERLAVPKNEPISEVLANLSDEAVSQNDKISFLEPRGLVNTGNMCYMNSVRLCWMSSEETTLTRIVPKQVLQILVSSVPFYQFLDHIGQRAAHSFQSEVPMIDAL